MNYDTEVLKEHLTDYVEKITRKSTGQDKYICPLCKSGTGKNHTGAFSIKGNRWKCFSCGESGDLFDLIGKVENLAEPAEQLRRARELYGTEPASRPAQKQAESEHTHIHIHTTDYTQYFNECRERLAQTDYHRQRGISDEVAQRFWIGYDPHYTRGTGGNEWQALIIPTGKHSFIARNTNPGAEDTNRYRKTGNALPFNAKALRAAASPIFITEGEIDALSIIEAGGEAVGLGSTANIKAFINNYIKNQKPVQPLMLALDNDEPGAAATEALAKELEALEIPYYRAELYSEEKDANAALLKDRAAFKQAIEDAKHIEDEVRAAEKEDYLKTSAANYIQGFIDDIAESVNTPVQPTGFKNLDEALGGGLYEGLYIIGAITSLGKTTLALQLADQIAESGRDVIIFSLEMSRAELMSKSISRQTLVEVLSDAKGNIEHAKTARGITTGARYKYYSEAERELINKAISAYGEYAQHIYIHEGIGEIGAREIREAIDSHITFTGNKPVVLVDYVQILAPYDVRSTDKQNTDKAILELKRISRDFKIPVIGISSFNRASYSSEVALEAFKESGAIEYGSDILIGLQLKGAGSADFDATAAKAQNPREIELVILKNRNGRTGDKLQYRYYALFNYFEETIYRENKRTMY